MVEKLQKENLIFILNPKCGFTWVEIFFNYYYDKIKNIKTPTFILIYRCPYKRIISFFLSSLCNYNYGGGIDNKINEDLYKYNENKFYCLLYDQKYKNECRYKRINNITFSQFIDYLITIDKHKLERHLRHQFYDISSVNKNKFDFIFNTDNINNEISTLLNLLNIYTESYNIFVQTSRNKFNKTSINNHFEKRDCGNLYNYKITELQEMKGLPNNHYTLFLNPEIKKKNL